MSEEENEVKSDYYHDADTGEFYKPDGEVYPYKFLPRKGEFHTSKGEILIFKDYPSRTLLDIQQRFEAKYEPVMPKMASEIGDGEYEWSSNPKDEGYIISMEKYQLKLGIVIMSLTFSFGLKLAMPKPGELPDDFTEFISLSFDPKNPYLKHHVRRKWVEQTMSTNQEIDILYALLQGRDLPTWQGVEQSAKRFPGDSERVSDTESFNAEAIGTD